MTGWEGAGPFERVQMVGRPGAGRVRFRRSAGDVELDLERPDPAAAGTLPAQADRLAVQPGDDGGVVLLVSLGAREWRVPARGWRVHERRDGFFDTALAPYAPTAAERRTVGLLLRLLRIPGTTRLIRAWHARRTR